MSEEQEPVIRVKDRRMFNADGSLRTPDPGDERREEIEVPPPAPAPAPTRPVEAAPAKPHPREIAPPALAEEAEEDDEFEEPAAPPSRPGEPSLFSDFTVNLASQAAMYMGLVDNPLGPRMPVDMHAARQMLDILGMLRDKTRGNLSAEEQLLLERILTDLRMQYVSLASTRR